MRSFYFGIALVLIAATGSVWHFKHETERLIGFCQKLALGEDIPTVRKRAEKAGFQSVLEPFAQMRIEPRGIWHERKPACRAFFNHDHELEYRLPPS